MNTWKAYGTGAHDLMKLEVNHEPGTVTARVFIIGSQGGTHGAIEVRMTDLLRLLAGLTASRS